MADDLIERYSNCSPATTTASAGSCSPPGRWPTRRGGSDRGGSGFTTAVRRSWTTPASCGWRAGSLAACGPRPMRKASRWSTAPRERKHRIAEEYLATHHMGVGVCSASAARWSGCSTPSSTAAGHAWTSPPCAPLFRGQAAAPYQPGGVAPTRRRDRETPVRPDGVQGPLRAADAQGLHQRRARAAFRGDRAQHPGRWSAIPTSSAGGDGRPVCTALDCVDVGFLPDGILDQLPCRHGWGQRVSAAST